MNSPLRVLHLEDDVRDTVLLQSTLEAEGTRSELTRVETEQDFISALKSGRFDLILADYTLPAFDGLSALRLAQEHAPAVPFLFVSATLGEDVAIEALKNGATDYVLKTRLARLGPSVTRALREAREKSERNQTQEKLNCEQQRFMDVVNSVDGIVWEANAGTFAFSFVSEQAERIVGYTIERWLTEPTFWKDQPTSGRSRLGGGVSLEGDGRKAQPRFRISHDRSRRANGLVPRRSDRGSRRRPAEKIARVLGQYHGAQARGRSCAPQREAAARSH
jgi:CheY-like chemotaxis protein